MSINKNRMAELLAKARAKKKAEMLTPEVQFVDHPEVGLTPEKNKLVAIRTRLVSDAAKNAATPAMDTTPAPTLSPVERARAALAAAKLTRVIDSLPELKDVNPVIVTQPPEPEHTAIGTTYDQYGNVIIYNILQHKFVDTAATGASCVLIGSAGTGKTTCMQGTMAALIDSDSVGLLQSEGHKYLESGTPGIVVISYTRRAVNNIKRVLPADLKANCITAHKLLEYQPEYYEVWDEATQLMKKTMQFIPTRNSENPLPTSIHTIIVEESSMLSWEMYCEINVALQHKVQWIFLGDIQQLPPVFGAAILGFKLLELPVVELTEVYRQALESPIIRLAQRILSGKGIPVEEFPEWKVPGQLTLHPWVKKLNADRAVLTLGAFFKNAIDKGAYDVDEDMILLPFNKACGTIELNKIIANHLARKHGRTTWEVLAGFDKHYFSVGDKVLCEKEDAEIEEITANPAYTGGRVQSESVHLDYWGHNEKAAEERADTRVDAMSDEDVDKLLEMVEAAEDRVRQASHTIVVRLLDTGNSVELKGAAEVNALLHSYALTVHKAQGSEWRKVFFCLHETHATMIQRELMYTAITRAKEELYVICEPDHFIKGIERQKITGDTLEEKAEFFKGKLEANKEYIS